MSLIETASEFAQRLLPRERFLALREFYMTMRNKAGPLMCAIYGTFDAAALRAHLSERVGSDFEIMMVHSSLNHMQPMYGGSPLDFVRMLMDFCAPDQTLVMPAFCFDNPTLSIGGARFDLRKTPSQMGLATELFRRSKGVVQSRHPIYRMAAWGPLAQQLTSGHERAVNAVGRGTPFDFMANHDTVILGIGKPLVVLTHVHHAEAVMGVDFPVPGHSGRSPIVTVVDGNEEFSVTLTSRSFEWRRNMWKLRSIMNRESLREWNFHRVPMFATRAGDVSEL